ncbi:hypothetical protein COCCADRAFT_93743 [Bipolaris zeicola 26-R-13]|uniref:Uncharacterized protein n=1 Tax=Cochliobolus carbonum (strain 26-R-13) TaxID=930089 RepID=W6YFV9_COCC2|nr:uncharacterized protein COCCADRAFT_93743 [Bipolaris zeicola 26-R-13]EUC34344.1 hypothetical protein COCCADRAFT_93743 [Bipolaris zeicola 26-R-13]
MSCRHFSVAKNPVRNTHIIFLLLLACIASQMQYHLGVASGQYYLDVNQGRVNLKKTVPTFNVLPLHDREKQKT